MHSYHYAPNWTIWIPFTNQTFTDKGKKPVHLIESAKNSFFKAILENKKEKKSTTIVQKSMRTAKQKGKSEKMGSELEGSHFFPKLNIFFAKPKAF